MRISLQMQREPFEQIIEQTLRCCARDAGWGDIEVHWTRGRSGSPGMREWLCCGFLNAIFLRGASPAALRDLADLFGHTGHRALSWVQSVYAKLCCSRLLAPAFADAHLLLSRDLPNQNELAIFIGNNRLRLMNAAAGTCRVVLKSGFAPDSIRREIDARRSASEVRSPRVLDSGPRYFTEEYVRALPLNRVANRNARAEIERVASTALARWSQRGARSEAARDTTERLRARIAAVIGAGSPALQPYTATFQCLSDRLARAVTSTPTGTILIGPSHGDFHAGNVLASGGTHYVVDWEFAGNRMVGYDGLVLTLEPRFSRGRAHRIGRFLQESDPTGRLASWDNLTIATRSERRTLLNLFLLEDLLFHAESNENPQFQRLTPGLPEYLRLLDRISPLT